MTRVRGGSAKEVLLGSEGDGVGHCALNVFTCTIEHLTALAARLSAPAPSFAAPPQFGCEIQLPSSLVPENCYGFGFTGSAGTVRHGGMNKKEKGEGKVMSRDSTSLGKVQCLLEYTLSRKRFRGEQDMLASFSILESSKCKDLALTLRWNVTT